MGDRVNIIKRECYVSANEEMVYVGNGPKYEKGAICKNVISSILSPIILEDLAYNTEKDEVFMVLKLFETDGMHTTLLNVYGKYITDELASRAQQRTKLITKAEGALSVNGGRELIADGVYRHFKDSNYRVLDLAYSNKEDEVYVVYQALYGNREVYARPYDMFISEVEKDKYPSVEQKYRFEYIGMKE